ncbi:hypothetical protein F753_11860 [Stutzerimonas chloritidismutans AW-1]|uniref:Uncharacterized protein n=1 Tax=Stutzerimonas chloritidismutans AW-1 TaxID=1263865 RepID=V4QHG4_STUCH|nr:hypothetical protein F753_11860 [Stutzerimonas chloritidismutans AW-1]
MPLGELDSIRAVECSHTEASSDRVHVAILLKPLVFREFHLATLTQLLANERHQLIRYVGDIREISEYLKGLQENGEIEVKGGLGLASYPLNLII